MKTRCFTLLAALLCACGGPLPQQALYDVAYGDDPQQRMDMHLIAGRDASTPLVVLIHGGGWMAGDKRDADFMVRGCTARGMNVVNINYRLGCDSIHYREMMADIDAAIGRIADCARTWGVCKRKYVLWGGSAGAHLALLYAYGYDRRDAVSAVITLGAPTCLDSPSALEGTSQQDLEGLLPLVTGHPWQRDSARLHPDYRAASPCRCPQAKPSMLIHGTADAIVPPRQSQLLDARLRALGTESRLLLLPGGGHGGENTSPEAARAAEQAMYEWIMNYSK